MFLTTPTFIVSPETAPELIKIADRALRAGGAKGRLPTPIEDLIRAADIVEDGDTEGAMKRFLSLLNEGGRVFFRSSMQKLRGIADLRERAVYVPSDTAPRERFAKGHELGHQLIPWHHIGSDRVSSFFLDNEYTLSPFVQDLFDVEANFFSSEVIFQGKQFIQRARDYRPTFDAVFSLADQHGASRQATLRRYIEAQDEIIAGISYVPSHYDAIDGLATLRAPWVYGRRVSFENVELFSCHLKSGLIIRGQRQETRRKSAKGKSILTVAPFAYAFNGRHGGTPTRC